MFAGMENKKTKCVLVMASRFDGEIQFSPNLWSSEKEAVAVFVETWIESHYLLKVITLSHEDRTDFEKEAQDSDREIKKVFNQMFLGGVEK